MIEQLLETAQSFALNSIYGLLFSGLLLGFSVLLSRKVTWVKHWRGYWGVLFTLCAGFVGIGFLPVEAWQLAPEILPVMSFLPLADISGGDVIPALPKPQDAQLNWQDIAALCWLVLYSLGTTVALAKLTHKLGNLKRLIRHCAIDVSAFEPQTKRLSTLQRLAAQRNIDIYITQQNTSPFIMQWFNSYLVISLQALNTLSDSEFKLMLKHELNHLKCGDGRWHLLVQFTLCFFWFNPLMKFIAAQLHWAVEVGCDNAVLKQQPNLRRTYAQAMLKVLRNTATPDANQTVAAFSSQQNRSMTMRINHIMNPTAKPCKRSVKNSALAGFIMAASAMALSFHPAVQAHVGNSLVEMTHPLPQARLTSEFGERNKFHKFHHGVDLAAGLDTPVLAAASGTVITAKTKLEGFENYGTVVVVDHGNGIKSLYSHLGDLSVDEGDKVYSGQMVGRVGLTGRTTGPHLHFEVLDKGNRVNPQNFIALNRK